MAASASAHAAPITLKITEVAPWAVQTQAMQQTGSSLQTQV